MKLKTTETPIMSGGNLQMKGFQIAASAKAFRILSSNLYKNKIRAIIRELSCNAVDGHIANGNKNSFDVSMPGMLDPQFIIRDYGCGMDDETIMNLYTTYFASTKSDSNDYIGALGLGSKSPFSYTDTFTVVSFFEGVRRVYSAFIKDGEPTITKVAEQETTEPNGIEITVPVNPQDVNKWRQEAKFVYSSFGEIRPNVKGIDIEYIPSDKDIVTVKNSVHGSGVFAIMGNIVYPLPTEVWNKTMINLSMIGQSSYSSQGTAVYIRFNLGELDITPSREELSLDDETMKNIKERIGIVNTALSVNLIKEVSEFTHIRKLKEHIVRKHNSSYWNHILEHPEFKMKNGLTVKAEQDIRTRFTRPTYDIPGQHGVTVKATVPIYRYDLSLVSPRGRKLDDYTLGPDFANYGRDSVNIFINDMKSGAIRTMKGLKMLRKFNGNYAYSIDVEYADEALKQFKKCWHDDELNIHYSSKSDDARKANPTAKRSKPANKPTNTVNVTQTSTTPASLYAKDIKELKGFWIPMKKNEYVGTHRESYMCSLESIRQFMKYRKIDEIPVIKSSHWKNAQANPNLAEVWDDMLKLVIELKDKLKIDIFPFTNKSDALIANLKKHKELEQYAVKLEKNQPETELYALFNDVLNRLYMFTACDSYKTNEATLKSMLTEFEKLDKLAREQGRSSIDKFKDDNKLITYYLERTYGYINDSYIPEIKRLIII